MQNPAKNTTRSPDNELRCIFIKESTRAEAGFATIEEFKLM
jgi:hypothetical protein